MSLIDTLRKELKNGIPDLKLLITESKDGVTINIKSGTVDMVYPDEVSEKYGYFPVTTAIMSDPDWMVTPGWAEVAKLKGVLDGIGSVVGKYRIYVGESPTRGYNK